MNVFSNKSNVGPSVASQPKEKKTFQKKQIRARRKRRRISSCLAEVVVDQQSAVPEFKTLPKTRVDHRKALIFQ